MVQRFQHTLDVPNHGSILAHGSALSSAHSSGSAAVRGTQAGTHGAGSVVFCPAVIAFLQGRILRKDSGSLVVGTGGVGYRVQVPVDALYELEEGAEVSLHIHTNVRDDAIELFGFRTPRELRLFQMLIGVSKVGPRMALALLSSIQEEELLAALRGGDVACLSSAPGVGRKTAERLHLELRDRVADLVPEGEVAVAGPKSDVVSALENLGYSRREAARAAESALEAKGPDTPFEEALRLALRQLSKHR
jgi:Holliday junction DNA helicase RuvA